MKKLLSLVMSTIMIISMTACSSGTKYDTLDRQQAEPQKCEDIASFVNHYLADQSVYLSDYKVEWIGYSHFSKKNVTLEDFEATKLGGYYKYEAADLGGDLVTGAVTCYWGENEEPVIQHLKIVKNGNADDNKIFVEYSYEKD